jgi:UDP-N-acetylglucosamine 1-carboxyvinyltransferase
MIAAAITNGEVRIENVVPDHLKPVVAKLKETDWKFQRNCLQ